MTKKPKPATVMVMALIRLEDTFRSLWECGDISTRLCNDVIRFCRRMDKRIDRVRRKDKP